MMKKMRVLLLCVSFCCIVFSCKKEKDPVPAPTNVTLSNVQLDDKGYSYAYTNTSVNPKVALSFSSPVDRSSVQQKIVLNTKSGNNVSLNYSYTHHDSTVVVTPVNALDYFTPYYLNVLNGLISTSENTLTSDIGISIFTQISTIDKFPRISDNELLDLVQKQTLKYFYDFADPASGMARERNTSGTTVTSGGTGFGIMAIIAGMDRNFITRSQGITHMNKIVTFLEKADRFHGAWSHWIDGSTGKVIPFSTKDNGETLWKPRSS